MHGSDYGKVVPWDKDAAHPWDIVGFPRAQLILEAQRHLMQVLRGVVERLTEDLPNDEPMLIPFGDNKTSSQLNASGTRLPLSLNHSQHLEDLIWRSYRLLVKLGSIWLRII